MRILNKLAILVVVLIGMAAGSSAEAARIYNETGRRIVMYAGGATTISPSNEKIIERGVNRGKLLSDSATWTENEGKRSPSIQWTAVGSVTIFMQIGEETLSVWCPNSDSDFQGGNYLIVTLEGDRLVAKMYDSNDKELWWHVTKK